MEVISRFAPSPTGLLHIGGVRTALFAWLYAKSRGGKCFLRFEDTDIKRSEQKYIDSILQDFDWLNINFDGKPFYQSQNRSNHLNAIKQLLEDGKAYYCNCSSERLEELRNKQIKEGLKPKYDNKCRSLDLEDSPDSAIRFKNPESNSIQFNDLIRGSIEISNEELDDLILLRNDGSPTYNLSVVVDDIEMSITHIIRGDDHISNTPRQINIFKALGKQVPEYGHVPMILDESGKRLSKREGALGTEVYKEMGMLPEALLNYLARLGWSLGDEEFFTIEDLVKVFKEGRLNNSASSFSIDKLKWYNKEYLSRMSEQEILEKLSKLSKNFSKKDESSVKALRLIKDRCSTLNEYIDNSDYLFGDLQSYDLEESRNVFTVESIEVLKILTSKLKDLNYWSEDQILKVIEQVKSEKQIGMKEIGQPFRLAITGRLNAPSLDKISIVLGRERVIGRIDKVIQEFS